MAAGDLKRRLLLFGAPPDTLDIMQADRQAGGLPRSRWLRVPLSADGELAVDVAHSSWNTDIASSEFELPLPRGTTVTDMVNHAQYVVGNPDPGKNLREMAADFRDLIPLGSVGEEHPRLYASQLRGSFTPPDRPFQQTIHLLYPGGKDAIIPELKACECDSKRVEVKAGKVIGEIRDNLGRHLQARREVHVKVAAPSTPEFFEARCKLYFVQGKSESLHYLSIAVPFVGGPLCPRPFRVVFSATQRAALIGQERLVEVEVERSGDVVILEGLPPWLEGKVEPSRGTIRVLKLKVVKQPPQSSSGCTLRIKSTDGRARAAALPVLVFGEDAARK